MLSGMSLGNVVAYLPVAMNGEAFVIGALLLEVSPVWKNPSPKPLLMSAASIASCTWPASAANESLPCVLLAVTAVILPLENRAGAVGLWSLSPLVYSLDYT